MKLDQTTIKRFLYRIRHDYLTMNNVVIAVAFLIAASWVWGSIESMQQNYQLEQMVESKRRSVELEKLRVANLELESKYFASHEYLDLAVRQRLGRGSPGENVLILPPANQEVTKPTIQSPAAPPLSNFQQWMNFLFGARRR